HGRASKVEVSFELCEGKHILSIEDNGPGLPSDAQRVEGVGLNVMRNRAELLGGWIEFSNSPKGGALVLVHLPHRSEP
ncbi:MAG TPA: ATP-binding protein, partial [Candidatus Synoicihabitans sp.]|nr:ATP-binding protein [Candidatus Synoicihabitans sp.]